jgi:hypothetical protein
MRTDITELLKPSDYVYYEQQPMPLEGWPDRDAPKALRKALDKAHDNVAHLVTEKDHLRAALLEMHEKQRRQLKIFIAVMSTTWSVLGWALHLLIPYAIHGMKQ